MHSILEAIPLIIPMTSVTTKSDSLTPAPHVICMPPLPLESSPLHLSHVTWIALTVFLYFSGSFWHGRGILMLTISTGDPTTNLYCNGSPNCIQYPNFTCTLFSKEAINPLIIPSDCLGNNKTEFLSPAPHVTCYANPESEM